MTINEFLIRRMSFSKTASTEYIRDQRIFINGVPARQKQEINDQDLIEADGQTMQSPVQYQYILYYKPRGIECTLNPKIADSLAGILPFDKRVFPVGRLDKESEGLLLLTNDGKLYNKIALADAHKEKEYEVQVDGILTDEAIRQWTSGVMIMGKMTRPATVTKLNEYTFRIVLTQGLNRQIRRMCYKLGYEVTFLKRTRIMSMELGDLQPGAYRYLSSDEMQAHMDGL